ncbi:MAG: O-methyltransferase [Dysgonamonadaceae bacterium]|jgi:predicted O-methyltransferase YrrM|nr:O-methyltransferase [Dysgonamonadaceae bacterium]MDD3356719.1 O-methyltransferase [Dysgonamonadaceae bacterium]HUI32213.1 O-methyltransferase [Dysgonamonadaceae bacterium]
MNEPKIDQYILSHIDSEPELLKKMMREAHVKLLRPRMISGNIQGRLLKMLTAMLRPKNILEIGTYTGYSALCLSEGAPKEAKIVTIEIDDEMEDFIRKYFQESEYGHKIELKIGNALQLIDNYDDNYFDLIFMDADKREYCAYYEKAFNKLRKNGIILADNTLWSGKVVDEEFQNDEQTRGVMEFNNHIKEDNRIEKVILPIRDGLTIIRKK